MNFNNLNEGDWQNLVYLLLLLAVLIPRIFSKNIPLEKVLKYLAIWSLVGLVVIVIYSYRYEFNDFKSKILGSVNPSSAIINQNGEIVLNMSQDGHFYIDTKINGFDVRFLIDTGASDMVISLKDAKKVGIDVDNLLFNKIYQTANGKSFGANVVLDEVEITDKKFYKVNASVNNAEMGSSLLGMSFLKKFKKYEFYRDQLILSL